nr:hypothetical protein [Smithella sp.]
RIAALQTELKKFDVALVETANGNFTLEGKFVARPVTIETYNDHRMAMSFAIAGLVVPGIDIRDKKCVDKSFPSFWEELRRL